MSRRRCRSERSDASAFASRWMMFLVLLGDLLLAGDRATRTLLRASVGVRPLTTNGQTAPMTDAAIRSDVHQSLDVHRDFGAERAFDLVLTLDDAANLVHVGIREIANAQRRIDARLLNDVRRRMATNSVDVRQSDLDLLVAWEIDARNTSHG